MRHIEETGDDDTDWLTIAGVVLEWRKRDRGRRELQRMSDRDLADIGLVRNDIEAVVRGNYERSRLSGLRACLRNGRRERPQGRTRRLE